MQKLDEFIRETDALTYINALKVTLTEIKNEVSAVEEMIGYVNQGGERIRKLVRKADNQYRLIAKAASTGSGSFANAVSIEDDVPEDIKKLMEET